MLTLDSTDLPLDAIAPTTTGAPILETESAGGAAAFEYSESAAEVSEAIAVTDSTPLSATLPAPEDAGAIISIVVNGEVYLPADEDQAEPGTFIWDDITNEIVIYPATEAIATGTPVVVSYSRASGNIEALPTEEVLEELPDWLGEWNATGTFSRSHSLGEQPSANFSFTALAEDELLVRSTFKAGGVLTAFGVGYSIAPISITRLPRSAYPGGFIQVEVPLTGRYVIKLALSHKVKDAIDADSVNGGTLSSLASVAGVPYSGPTIKLNRSYSTPGSVATTLGSELEERAIAANGFVFYSKLNGVEIREWGKTPIHWLSRADLISEIQVQFGGDGNEYEAQNQDNQLAEEYKNTRLTLDTDANERDRQRNTLIWIDDADELYASPPDAFFTGQLSLANLSHNFDSGGVTKEQIRTLYRNGTVQKVIKNKWGFAYKGIQVYAYNVTPSSVAEAIVNWYKYVGGNPNAFWQIVETTEEYYNYDQLEGYLTRVSIVGYRLGRMKQEQDAIETIKAEYAPTITKPSGEIIFNGEKQRDAYRFKLLPSSDITYYLLSSYLGLYPDIQRPKDDRTWVEPKYAAVTRRYVTETQLAENPYPNKPDLIAGKAFTETSRVVVNYPQRGDRTWEKEYEQYTVSKKTTGIQGESLKDALNIGRRTENLGRPSTHTRMDIIRPNPFPPSALPPADQTPRRALLNSPNNGYGVDDPEEGSIQIPSVFDYEEARRCAETSLSIANTKAVEVWTVRVRRTAAKDIKEGDRVHLLGKLLIVLSAQEDMAIQGVLGDRVIVNSGGVNLQLGLYLRPPVTLTFDEP